MTALRRLLLAPVLLVTLGCESTYDSIERFFCEDNHLISCEEHPWHQVPGHYTFAGVTIIVFVPLLPIWLAETLIFEQGTETGRQISKLVAGSVGAVVGSAVALPFYVGGLPWEERCGGGSTPESQPGR